MLYKTGKAVDSDVAAMGNGWDGIPADVFVDIMQRLPPSPRRRLRLICRHWRDVIDDRMPGRQTRAMVLASVVGYSRRSCAFVIDDLTEEQAAGGGRELKLHEHDGGAAAEEVSMVGTCNGLLCLHHHPNGDLVVVNPITGEKIAVPPPSKSPREFPPAASYSFAYHRATGLYKIVRLRCHRDGGTFAAVDMFTLGDRSWREVPVPVGTSCLLGLGLVSTGGATYWVATDAHSLMSFDLKDERVVFVTKLPVSVVGTGLGLGLSISSHLTTDVHGRLGIAVCSYEMKRTRTPKGIQTRVWMLEGGGRNKKLTWALRHKIVEPGQEEPLQQIACPLAVHGENLLTTQKMEYGEVSLHASPLSEVNKHCSVVRTTECAPPPPLLISMYDSCRSLRTFAYVETLEPVAFYGCGGDIEVGDVINWNWRFDSGEGRWKLMLHSTFSWDDIDLPIS